MTKDRGRRTNDGRAARFVFGDTFRLVDLDGVFVLTPMAPMVSELAREIERVRLQAGLSTEELLNTLREQRQRYHQENYE